MNILDFIISVFLYLVIFQLITISHELGHAIPALIFSKDKVYILLGNGSRKIKTIVLGRLEVKIKGFNPMVGFVWWNTNKMSRGEKIICCVGGPFVSLFIGIVFMLIGKSFRENLLGQFLILSAYFHFYQFIVTAMPIRYPKFWKGYAGHYSDGYNIILLLKNH